PSYRATAATGSGAEDGYARDYDFIPTKISLPAWLGYGNPDNSTSDSAARFRQYMSDRMGPAHANNVGDDPTTGNYSWDWGQLHLVELNVFGDKPGQTVSQRDAQFARVMTWLHDDLAANAGDSRPVILFAHYTPSGAKEQTDFIPSDHFTTLYQ